MKLIVLPAFLRAKNYRWNDLGYLIGEFRILFRGDQRFMISRGHHGLVPTVNYNFRKGGGERKKERKGRKKKEEG